MKTSRISKLLAILLALVLLLSIAGMAEDLPAEGTDTEVEQIGAELIEAELVEAVPEEIEEIELGETDIVQEEYIIENTVPGETAPEETEAEEHETEKPVSEETSTEADETSEPAPAVAVPTETPTVEDAKVFAAQGNTTLPASLVLGQREQYALNLQAINEGKAVTFKLSKKKIVTVDAKGVITAKKKGKTVVTALVNGTSIGSCTVTVKVAPKKVTLSSKTLVLNKGASGALKATLTKKSAGKITWTSSNANVAKVAQNGVVTAVARGTATITASAYNGKRAACTVTVIDGTAPKSLSMNITAVTLGVKETVKVIPRVNSGAGTIYTYKVKNKKVASVGADGTIRGKKAGKTVVTVETHNGLTAKVNVTVKKAPKKVTLSPKTLALQVGGKAKLTAKLPKKTGGRITYSSSNPKVATVDQSGNVTAVAVGSATITVQTYNGKRANCTVYVTAKPTPTPAPTPIPQSISIVPLLNKTITEVNSMIPDKLNYDRVSYFSDGSYNGTYYNNPYIFAKTSKFNGKEVVTSIGISKKGPYKFFEHTVGDSILSLEYMIGLGGFTTVYSSDIYNEYRYKSTKVFIDHSGSKITCIVVEFET